jgi:ribosomal protein L40E
MVRTLVALCLGLGLGITLTGDAFGAGTDEHLYVGVSKCKTCHKKKLIGNQYGAWQDAKHSKAFESLKSEDAIKLAKEKGIAGPPHEAEECLKCHATAFGLKPEQLAKKPLKLADGIQCESCHGPGKDYRKKKVMADHDKSLAAGMWDAAKDEKICMECHNEDATGWDPQKYELADGSKVGFDFEKAKEEIAHLIPEDVKGKYLEVEKKLKAEKRARGEAEEEEEEEE